jgi:hypothetical protein
MWSFAKNACTRAVEWTGTLSWWSSSARPVIVNVTVAQYTVSQQRLTVHWLAPRESDRSRIHSKVSSDWLPSYNRTTRPVLEIFKMAGYFPDSPPAYCKPRILKVTHYLLMLIKLYTEVHFGKWPLSFPWSVCWHWLSWVQDRRTVERTSKS